VRLSEMREQLEPLFPGIKKQYESVRGQLEMLRHQREEIESADQEELRKVREEISIVGEGLETRKREMEIREKEALELSSEEAELRKLIDECRIKIDRAERVKELNRGFEKNEVEEFKGMSRKGYRLTVVNLRCLQQVSGWEVRKVEGVNVKMAFRNEVIVSFNTDLLSHGGSATVEIPPQMDPIQQFMYTSLTPSILKGDVRTVSPRHRLYLIPRFSTQ